MRFIVCCCFHLVLFFSFSIWFEEIVIKSCFGLYGQWICPFGNFNETKCNESLLNETEMFTFCFFFFRARKKSVCRSSECSSVAIVQFPIKLHCIHSPNTENPITQNYKLCQMSEIKWFHFFSPFKDSLRFDLPTTKNRLCGNSEWK